MASEALSCFTSILEQVPKWTAELEEILKTSTQRQNEMVTAHQPATQPARTVSRQDSVSEFFRPASTSAGRRKVDMPIGDDQRPLLQHMTNSDELRLSQRKRKTASVCSGDESGPSKFRVRNRAVVYFDGDVQKSFESLVRSIGSARNSIRKGKMSAKVDSLSRSGSSSGDSSASDGEEAGTFDISKLQPRAGARQPSSPRPFAPRDNTEAFDKVDKRLGEAQGLCERAAHQMLRSGTCATEVSAAREQLLESTSLIEAALPAMRRRAEKVAARQRRSDEREQAAAAAAAERKKSTPDKLTPAQVFNAVAVAFPAESTLEVDDIEVDDDSDGDTCDLTAIPLGKYAHMRSPRLAASAC